MKASSSHGVRRRDKTVCAGSCGAAAAARSFRLLSREACGQASTVDATGPFTACPTVMNSDLSAEKLDLRLQLLSVQAKTEKDGGQDAGLRAGEISGEYGSGFGKVLSSAIAVDGLDAASRAARRHDDGNVALNDLCD